MDTWFYLLYIQHSLFFLNPFEIYKVKFLIVIIVSEIVTPANTATSTTDKPKDEKKPNESTVDLTLSDSDDDEPLAKRRAINPKPGK